MKFTLLEIKQSFLDWWEKYIVSPIRKFFSKGSSLLTGFIRYTFKELWEPVRDVIPIILVAVVFQAIILKQPFPDITPLSAGILLIIAGLFFFLKGLNMGVFPLGENLAYQFVRRGNLFYILIFGFVITFSAVVAEPAVTAIALKAESVSEGKIGEVGLRITMASAAGLAVSLGILRSALGHPIQIYLIPGYIFIIIATFLSPKEIIALAYDAGGVTTSTITVPLVTAIGIGLASSIRGRNPLIEGFGLIGFAVMLPILFVMGYGIAVYYSGDEVSTAVYTTSMVNVIETTEEIQTFTVKGMINNFILTIRDIMPLAGAILFFQLFVLRQAVPNAGRVVMGFFLVLSGLYIFIHGLNLGLFPLGESMAYHLTEGAGAGLPRPYCWIYVFSFLIGFACTIAEPSIIAVSLKIQDVSDDTIGSWKLRLVIATGVAAGITLGSHRIISGAPLYVYIIAGYLTVIVITLLSPRYIIPIAYDTGGATTSTVTVPLVTALGIGLATNIPGRDPFMDGFGLIAFASIFPLITVMGYGILSHHLIKRRQK